MALDGVVGLIMTNTEPGVAPFGSKDKVLGTNPLALGCPTDAEPVVLDMSTSVVARGKIVLAEREGRRIPAGWAIDQDGQSTTSPTAALMGALLPVGGPKGSGLSFFVDVLAGALSGSAVGLDVKGTFDMRAKGTKGDFLLALDPDFFGGRAIFLQSVMALLRQIRSASPAEGHEQVLAPGDLERSMREQRLRAGLPLDAALVEQLHRIPKEPRNRP
jgi:L-2-hydroxycarboxylate dehydrogenase (NAD+)